MNSSSKEDWKSRLATLSHDLATPATLIIKTSDIATSFRDVIAPPMDTAMTPKTTMKNAT